MRSRRSARHFAIRVCMSHMTAEFKLAATCDALSSDSESRFALHGRFADGNKLLQTNFPGTRLIHIWVQARTPTGSMSYTHETGPMFCIPNLLLIQSRQ